MKKIYLFLCLLIAAGCTDAQTLGANSGIPPYHILTTDSVYVTPANLKKNKPVMIIYFAPDCGHCQHLMYDLKPQLPNIKDVQIVMITFVTQLKAIQVFRRDFGLEKYHNITIGTEGYTYLVQKFYQIKNTPYIAIYDHNGKLAQAYDKVPRIPVLMQAIKKV
ncbi:TlpA family protein disulfide reductase [Mucilaginibacter pocheonensis]|uniref:Thioredoxin-related protein n=1 Tax=Mucilaginibacter pocheonensis TaxID=398050 RepID=A0ABU1T925_9SPHI|nr:thioredoxin fold domain-containing protein [Mucilaginibacter pocheonensis]MDR6941858.1 thioredoxin-related protein [Mucilaginibacter pocheonensis]